MYTGAEIRLGVSGMGFEKARYLTSKWVVQINQEISHQRISEQENARSDKWLNFGIAGSAAWPVGSIIFANQVSCGSSGQKWDLSVPESRISYSEKVLSLASPSDDYHAQYVYEMEAGGILSALSAEQIAHSAYVLKLISDNPDQPMNNLDKSIINQLINKHQSKLINTIDLLL